MALPAVLLILTAVTGIVDAVSYLALGHVFVANMTGNIVFLGFGAVGIPGVLPVATVLTVASFLGGAAVGGRLGVAFDGRTNLLLRSAVLGNVGCVVLSILLALRHDLAHLAIVIAVLLAFGMGLQNAVARKIHVLDMTTTVLTLTLTGLAADSRLAGGKSPRLWRRLSSVGAMCLGAFVGGGLLRQYGVATALGCALVALLATAIGMRTSGAQSPSALESAHVD